jgi:hypothetical protein
MTRTVWTLAWLLLLLSAHPRADDLNRRDPHLRADDPDLVAAIADATDRSPTFRSLLDRLNRSDVVVYVKFDREPGPELAGRTTFVSVAGGRRYLRIGLDRRYFGCQRLGILGHELRHAVEIADEAAVTDNTSLAALYRQIGFRSGQEHEDRFDSLAAIDAGHRIQHEIAAGGLVSR